MRPRREGSHRDLLWRGMSYADAGYCRPVSQARLGIRTLNHFASFHCQCDPRVLTCCCCPRWQGFVGGVLDDSAQEDVFDHPEAEPDCLFVNPFATSVNPLDWRKLQAFAESAEDLEADLMRQGVYFSGSAVSYLTPGQLENVTADLIAMEDSLSFEMTAWLLTDCLARAKRANDRLPVSWR